MKSVIFTTFFTILLQESHQNFIWKVVTSFNVNPPLKLFFYSLILANNNLLLKIYCENIVVAFLFFFLIIFPFLITSIRFSRFFFFSSWIFLHHTRIPLISLSTLLFLFLVHFGSHFLQLSLSSSLFFYFFYFYLILEHSLAVIRNRERTSDCLLHY